MTKQLDLRTWIVIYLPSRPHIHALQPPVKAVEHCSMPRTEHKSVIVSSLLSASVTCPAAIPIIRNRRCQRVALQRCDKHPYCRSKTTNRWLMELMWKPRDALISCLVRCSSIRPPRSRACWANEFLLEVLSRAYHLPVMNTVQAPHFSKLASNASYDSIAEISLVSSTVEDQPGPGRRLGRFTRWAGKKLEGAAGRVAAVLLLTPEVLRRRIEALLEGHILTLAFDKVKGQGYENVKIRYLEGTLGKCLEEMSVHLQAHGEMLICDFQVEVHMRSQKGTLAATVFRQDRMPFIVSKEELQTLRRDCKALLEHTRSVNSRAPVPR